MLSGKIVQRPVLYLGEVNDSQREGWCKVIEAFDEDRGGQRALALFAWDRKVPGHAADYGVQVRLKETTPGSARELISNCRDEGKGERAREIPTS
jgi:hypothetical protein